MALFHAITPSGHSPLIELGSEGILCVFDHPTKLPIHSPGPSKHPTKQSYFSSPTSTSRSDPVKQPWKRHCLANMLDAAHPCSTAFDAHSKSSMLHTAITAKIQIPVKRLFRQIVFFKLLPQERQRGCALSATNYLAVTFRGQHIDAKSKFGPFSVALHVKRFDDRWVMMDHHRLDELTGYVRFIRCSKIAAPFKARR